MMVLKGCEVLSSIVPVYGCCLGGDDLHVHGANAAWATPRDGEVRSKVVQAIPSRRRLTVWCVVGMIPPIHFRHTLRSESHADVVASPVDGGANGVR